LPPAGNLRAFLAAGADLVAFSGGKAIGGPQASGILCGRAELVSSAVVQMLDLDLQHDAWRAPPEFAALAQLRGLPHHGIGRSCKAGKEEIVGLLTALERFAAEGDGQRRERLRAVLDGITEAAGEVARCTAGRIAQRLRTGPEPIACNVVEGALVFSPLALAPEHAAIIGRRLRDAMAGPQTLRSARDPK